MKLKALLALTAALAFGVAAAQDTTAAPATTAPTTTAPTLTDVPAGVYAKDAVDRLVREGIILGFPDGTFRGTQSLTRYQAAVIIARVLDRIAQNGTTGISNDTITALQNAVQELAADLAALGVRVSDLEENAATKDDIARIEQRLEGLNTPGADTAALDELRAQISALSGRVDELSGNYDTLRADVDDNASSIAALNDLTVLLNQDILSLQDRVSAIEGDYVPRSDFDTLSNRVGTIDTRVTTLESRPVVSLTGGLTSTNGSISLTSGTTNFDIDRLTTGTFLGSSLSNDDVTAVDTKPNDVFSYASSDFSFGLGVTNLKTATGQFAINQAGLSFGVNNLFSVTGTTVTTPGGGTTTLSVSPTIRLKTAALTGTIANSPFVVGYNADYSKFKFNEYVFDNDAQEDNLRRGVVGTFTASFLPFAPAITIVGGNGTLTSADPNPAAGTTVEPSPGAYFGIRASINPVGFGALGLSYATGSSAFGTAGAAGPAPRDILSADLSTTLGPVNLDSVYVSSTVRPLGLGSRNQAFYARGSATFGIANAVANFRAIDPAFANGEAGLSQDGLQDDNNAAPFIFDQYGYGAGAGVNLGFATVNAYGDYRVNYTGGGVGAVDFGVNAGAANFFAGLGLVGFYNSSVANGGLQQDQAPFGTNSGYDAYATSTSATATYQGSIAAPYRFTSSFGAVLTHNGAAANALVPNLNLAFGYAHFYNSGANDFQAYGDYSGSFSGFTIKPFARYHTNSGGAVRGLNFDTGVTPALGYSTYKVGAQLATTPFAGIFFSPSLDSGIAYRNTSFSNSLTANELYGKIGLVFNEFFAPNVTFGVGYSFYSGTNINSITTGSSFDAFNSARDRVIVSAPSTAPFQTAVGGQGGTLNGVYAQLNVYGVKASYGIFNMNINQTNDPVAAPLGYSAGQGFKLGYEVKF